MSVWPLGNITICSDHFVAIRGMALLPPKYALVIVLSNMCAPYTVHLAALHESVPKKK